MDKKDLKAFPQTERVIWILDPISNKLFIIFPMHEFYMIPWRE